MVDLLRVLQVLPLVVLHMLLLHVTVHVLLLQLFLQLLGLLADTLLNLS